MILKTLIGFCVLIFVLPMLLWVVGPEKLWRQFGSVEPVQLSDWVGKSTPNWSLACPSGQSISPYCKGTAPTHESPVVVAAADEVYQWLIARIEADGEPSRNSGDLRTASGIRVIQRDDDNRKIRFEALSPHFRFPDIIDLEVFELPDQRTGFAVLSQSTLGTDDFGLNAKRMRRFLEDFTDIFVHK